MNPAPNLPRNLGELLDQGIADYELGEFYFLELDHTLWGFFPAIFRESNRIVITTDRLLLERVWKTMTSRKSKVGCGSGYIHNDGSVVFPVLGTTPKEVRSSEPQKILSSVEFEELLTQSNNPFEWAPGLVGDDMTREEFIRTLEATRANF